MTASCVEAAMFAVAMCVAGSLFPDATAWVLARAQQRSDEWWWQCMRRYRDFRAEGNDKDPSPRAHGVEGALGVWLADTRRLAAVGALSRERVDALAAAGICDGAWKAAECEGAKACDERFPARFRQRILPAVVGMFAGVVVGAQVMPALLKVLLCLCTYAMAIGVACDLRERMLPLECSVVIAVAGAVWQVCIAGVAGVVAGAVAAAATVSVCMATNALRVHAGNRSIGQGDVRCMAALSMASGAGALFGALACYGVAAAFSLVGIASKRFTLRDSIPFAPFLSLWLGAGLMASLG